MRKSTRRTALRRRRDAGASIVELAFIAPVMVLLVFGVLDLGRAYRMQIRLESAAREGAALAQLNPEKLVCATEPDIESRLTAEEASLADTPGFAWDVYGENSAGDMVLLDKVCGGDVVASGGRVRVDVSAPYEIVTPLVASAVGSTIHLEGSAEVRVQGIQR